MIPPNPASTDPLGYSNRVSDAIAAAVQKAGTKNVVVLSSVGADKSSGTGPVVGLHHLEQKLNQISNANVLYLRAATSWKIRSRKSTLSARWDRSPDRSVPISNSR